MCWVLAHGEPSVQCDLASVLYRSRVKSNNMQKYMFKETDLQNSKKGKIFAVLNSLKC